MIVPTINPTVKYRTVATLKKLILPELRAHLEFPVVIQETDGQPVAVLVPWAEFIALQEAATNNFNNHLTAVIND